jgi:hypothetical protein
MRSEALSALNARKVTCKNGHGFSHVNHQGRRVCRICMNAWAKEYQRKRKLEGKLTRQKRAAARLFGVIA